MNKKNKWPKEEEVKRMRETLSKGPATRIPSRKLSIYDQTKYDICEQIIKHKNGNHLTQRELAEKIGEDEALISKVVRYHYEEFTIDRLLKFLAVLYPNAELKVKVA